MNVEFHRIFSNICCKNMKCIIFFDNLFKNTLNSDYNFLFTKFIRGLLIKLLYCLIVAVFQTLPLAVLCKKKKLFFHSVLFGTFSSLIY